MQVPDELRKCVAFLFFTPRNAKERQCAGTAFWVASIHDVTTYSFSYLVTARHVIAGIQQTSGDGKVFVRVNMTDGSLQFLETHVSEWLFHPDESSWVDVAARRGFYPQDEIDFLPIPVELAATDEVIKKYEIGIGDEIFLTGLFSRHFGQEKNLPIVRAGNIAQFPEEPIETPYGLTQAFLVESRSIGGLSGSPVFVHLGTSRVLGGRTRLVSSKLRFWWLGLIQGHWDEKAQIRKPLIAEEYVNMGIAFVIPTRKILEVVDQA